MAPSFFYALKQSARSLLYIYYIINFKFFTDGDERRALNFFSSSVANFELFLGQCNGNSRVGVGAGCFCFESR